jgi:signal recognition particle subunit SRP54
VRRALLEADVALEVVRGFTDRVREKAVGAEVLKSIKPGQMVVKIVHDELVEMLGTEGEGIEPQRRSPVVIMMVGLQGSGKTTTSAKIAKRLTDARAQEGADGLARHAAPGRPGAASSARRPDRCRHAADRRRPVARRDRARAVQAAKLGGHDVVILDTAGRTHIDEPLMVEMADIKKKANPHEILLVADALTGQDAVNLARNFDERVGITGLVLTRMDGDGRGGARCRCAPSPASRSSSSASAKDGRARRVPSAPHRRPHPRHGRHRLAGREGRRAYRRGKGRGDGEKMARASSTWTISPISCARCPRWAAWAA